MGISLMTVDERYLGLCGANRLRSTVRSKMAPAMSRLHQCRDRSGEMVKMAIQEVSVSAMCYQSRVTLHSLSASKQRFLSALHSKARCLRTWRKYLQQSRIRPSFVRSVPNSWRRCTLYRRFAADLVEIDVPDRAPLLSNFHYSCKFRQGPVL